jgi:hypothetical protein
MGKDGELRQNQECRLKGDAPDWRTRLGSPPLVWDDTTLKGAGRRPRFSMGISLLLGEEPYEKGAPVVNALQNNSSVPCRV